MMKTFDAAELPSHLDELVSDAATGSLSLIMKDGEPAFLAVPLTDEMFRGGLAVSLAVKLFDEEAITLREGARMARITLTEFMHACSERAVAVVAYPPAELEMELRNIERVADSG
jgi:predicted HTH domain antitoxin